jgi:uncharacterized membrane protein YtjA (UPF0391 family)
LLRWALLFIIAITRAGRGFGGIAAGAADIARICFFFFLVVFVVSLVWGLGTSRRPRGPNINK